MFPAACSVLPGTLARGYGLAYARVGCYGTTIRERGALAGAHGMRTGPIYFGFRDWCASASCVLPRTHAASGTHRLVGACVGCGSVARATLAEARATSPWVHAPQASREARAGRTMPVGFSCSGRRATAGRVLPRTLTARCYTSSSTRTHRPFWWEAARTTSFHGSSR